MIGLKREQLKILSDPNLVITEKKCKMFRASKFASLFLVHFIPEKLNKKWETRNNGITGKNILNDY